MKHLIVREPLDPLDIMRRRLETLVPHARGKCPDCGDTLVTDPLPHRCNPTESPGWSVTALLAEAERGR